MTRQQLMTLKAWARPQRPALMWCAALMTLESVVALSLPWLGGQFAGRLWPGSVAGGSALYTTLGGLVGLMVGAAALQALLQFGSAYWLERTGLRMLATLKQELYNHLQALPLGYFHARRLGDSLALVTRDVELVSGFITNTLVSLAPMLLTVAGAAVFMFGIAPWLAALCVVLIPLFVVLLRLFGRRLRPLSAALSEQWTASYALFEENLSLLPAIKTFTREAQESLRVHLQVERIRELGQREARIRAGLGPLVQFLALSGILLLLWLASSRLYTGELQPSGVVSFLLYAHLLTRPVPQLARVYGEVQVTRAALDRMLNALGYPVEPDPPGAQDAKPLTGDIRFDALHFAYPGREPVLRGVDLCIRAGETVAIVGLNGAGKSTLSHLLLRLVTPSAGRVLLDGQDMALLPLADLRRQIGLVPQLPMLFHASVLDNIAYGLPQATPAQVQHAARLACAHEFIEALPDGYGTVIGDRGVRLSGGQQQRVSLARALLKDPAILILDEATSMFDPEAEADFLQIVKDALRGRTVLFITHRPASLALADRILRLRDGQVSELR